VTRLTEAEVAAVIADRPAMALDELLATADLQTRYDTKHVVALPVLAQVVAALPESVAALDAAGHRSVGYRTTYFDSPDLVLYRAHLQGRRRRFKVRTRRYSDRREVMLEVKARTQRGMTAKHRIEHPGPADAELSAAALAFVAGELAEHHGLHLPPGLVASATIEFDRATLYDRAARERLTIDWGLQVDHDGQRLALAPGLAVVEVKSTTPRSASTAVLRSYGVHPCSFSKYCAGLEGQQGHLRRNHSSMVVRRALARAERSPDRGWR
jgi:hypothetical protein